jgi:alpha-L-rhamnosidase
MPDELQFVNASYKSAYGLIKSNWKKNAGIFEWNISIPANTSARIFIPARSEKDVTESGKPLNSDDIKIIGWKANVLTIEVPSGDHQFKSTIK